MTRKQRAIHLLSNLGADLAAADANNPETATEAGVVLEVFLKGLPRACNKEHDILALALGALQAIGEGTAPDPSKFMASAANVVAATARLLSGDAGACEGDSAVELAEMLNALVHPQDKGPATAPARKAGAEGDNAPGVQAGLARPQPVAILPAKVDAEILDEFVVECRERITNAEASLLDLQDDPNNADRINAIFRAFHTIKGTSAMLGLDWIQGLARQTEDILAGIRDKQTQITSGCVNLLLESCDVLKGMIASLEGAQPGNKVALPTGVDDLRKRLAGPQAWQPHPDAAAPPPATVADLSASQAGETIGNTGPAQALAAGDLPEEISADQSDSPAVSRAKGPTRRKETVDTAVEGTIRVRASKLDSLVNAVGELSTAQAMVAQDPLLAESENKGLAENIARAEKIVAQLQDLALSLRMVPMRNTFHKMARLVHDLGEETGKRVRFVCEGEETEIDRNLVEVINDPLVHLVRNAIDHGIESTEDRLRIGKKAEGVISLRAYHAGGYVVIELTDDGKGIDRDNIIAKVTDLGLIESAEDLDDVKLFDLLCEPGLTTAEPSGDLSGRGVGLDVVKKATTDLHGRVALTSTSGEGTTVALYLPLTLAITDTLVIRVGAQRLLLPTLSIEQNFSPGSSAITTVMGKGEVVTFRDSLLSVFRLGRLFGEPEAPPEPSQGPEPGKGVLIVVKANERRCALLADELLGRQQVVIKSLGTPLTKAQEIMGAAILPDGQPGLVLDPAGLLALACGDGRQNAAPTTGKGLPKVA